MMREMASVLAGWLALTISSGIVSAAVLHVPDEYATIQAGIDASVDGDTVMVAEGTYAGEGNRDIDFAGKGVVLLSEHGPALTVIDCEGSEEEPHRGFYFYGGEDSTSAVQGFTVTNGYVTDTGGGIRCRYSSSPTIRDNAIVGNTASYGGGIYCESSSPIINSTLIGGNHADQGGGGIRCYSNASPRIEECAIISNTAEVGGGGICCWDHCSPQLSRNVIAGNVTGSGGGIYCNDNSSPTIAGTAIAGNTADYGGGVRCYDFSSPLLVGCTFAGNWATAYGGAFHNFNSSPTLLHSILYGDSAGTSGDEIYSVGADSVVVSYSDVEGGWPGEGNIDAFPMFVLAERRDYRLLWHSPCIDAGHPDSLDPDGTRCDMGASYFDQNDYLTLYLTPDATSVPGGGTLGITYTAINRWAQPEVFWVLTQVTMPNGSTLDVLGPDQYTLPGDVTVVRRLVHNVPLAAPLGRYRYRSMIGVPPSTLYDEDAFRFTITAE